MEMATRFLDSLSSVIYVGQIFGIMPVLRRRNRRPAHILQTSGGGGSDGRGKSTSDRAPMEKLAVAAEHEPHDMVRVFGGHDANGRVNIRAAASANGEDLEDGSGMDYVKSDKSSNLNATGQGGKGFRRRRAAGGGHNVYYVTQFNWKYPNAVYATLLIALGSLEWLCTVYGMVASGVSLGTIGAFNFYTITNFGLIMFFNLARKWSRIFRFWMDAAQVFDQLPYRGSLINPGAKVRNIFGAWALVALVDTLLYRGVSVAEVWQLKAACTLQEGYAELLYRSWRGHVFRVIDFHAWQIPLLEAVNISYTFAWTYMDVFIMMISVGLQSMFQLWGDRLRQTQGKRMPYAFWIELRTHYVILRNLVEFIDEHISILIVISFASNLYFICLQLFNSFVSHYKSWLHAIYFCNTLLLVIVRSFCVLWYSSQIAVTAKRPLVVLRRIPTALWNDELQRLQNMMSHDVVALSGAGFFSLTRSLVLVMMGTVATYELVIMDLHGEVNQAEPSLEIVCPPL